MTTVAPAPAAKPDLAPLGRMLLVQTWSELRIR